MYMYMYSAHIIMYEVVGYRIAGNFRGRKLSRISRFFSHPRKFSPRNSRYATPIMRPVLVFRESFLREMLLSYRSVKVFSLENFPLYGNNYTCILCTYNVIYMYTLYIVCSVLFLNFNKNLMICTTIANESAYYSDDPMNTIEYE